MTFTHLLLSSLFLTTLAVAETDREEVVSGINLTSAKNDSHRVYHAESKREFPVKADYVAKAILNFADRCNNGHKKMRIYTDKERDCRYHVESHIESFFVTEFDKSSLPQNDYTDWYLLGRQVYNRGHYGYYELVEVLRKTDTPKKSFTITVKMLSDEEAKKFTDIKFKRESSFHENVITYHIEETGADSSELRYDYRATTDHWILNKAISVPQVFASIGKNLSELMQNIETDATRLRREIAASK